jgi:hypothetical protein
VTGAASLLVSLSSERPCSQTPTPTTYEAFTSVGDIPMHDLCPAGFQELGSTRRNRTPPRYHIGSVESAVDQIVNLQSDAPMTADDHPVHAFPMKVVATGIFQARQSAPVRRRRARRAPFPEHDGLAPAK